MGLMSVMPAIQISPLLLQAQPRKVMSRGQLALKRHALACDLALNLLYSPEATMRSSVKG